MSAFRRAKEQVERLQAVQERQRDESRPGFPEATPAGDAYRRFMGRLLRAALRLGVAGVLFSTGVFWGPGSVDVVRLGHESHAWPSVEGVVTHSEFIGDSVRVWRGKGSAHTTSRRLWDIRYDYTVDGRAYSGRRVKIGYASELAFGERAKAYVARYPVGRRVRVYHRPSRPWYSTLEPGVAPSNIANLAILGVAFLLGCGVLYTFRFERWLR